MTTNGTEEENPKVAQYSVTIVDRPDNEFIVLTARGKFKGVSLQHQKLINRMELASANYNLMALSINRIAKNFRAIIEQYEIDPVLKLTHIYLPESWSSYEAPDWLIAERKLCNDGYYHNTTGEKVAQTNVG